MSVDVSISIVSHRQASMVKLLLDDLNAFSQSLAIEVILVLNLSEVLPFFPEDYAFPIHVVKNTLPLGFAANHNQAYKYARGAYFCVLNPDIRIHSNPFPDLLRCFENSGVGIVAPLVLGTDGHMEDSARRFPGPLKILCKAIGRCQGGDYIVTDENIFPDWAAGMFLIFPRHIYEKLQGFDVRYFLYYEDVDMCARLKLLGYSVVLCPRVSVVHHAQRSSHRSFKYFSWHLRSMIRFFLSPVYWRLKLKF